MSLEDYPQISEERKKRMLAMSDAELLIEIEKDRFPQSIPIMKAILEDRKNTKEAEQEHQEAILQEARLANLHSKEANETSNKAFKLSIFAIVVSLVAIIVSMN